MVELGVEGRAVAAGGGGEFGAFRHFAMTDIVGAVPRQTATRVVRRRIRPTPLGGSLGDAACALADEGLAIRNGERIWVCNRGCGPQWQWCGHGSDCACPGRAGRVGYWEERDHFDQVAAVRSAEPHHAHAGRNAASKAAGADAYSGWSGVDDAELRDIEGHAGNPGPHLPRVRARHARAIEDCKLGDTAARQNEALGAAEPIAALVCHVERHVDERE
mmetsp:Transcript_134224/g.417177  ORF Transcript_134224/g.417177 Transcript_134224/m.417177 type:complete len:218 (-) Transcript_134224:402-1055(-)